MNNHAQCLYLTLLHNTQGTSQAQQLTMSLMGGLGEGGQTNPPLDHRDMHIFWNKAFKLYWFLVFFVVISLEIMIDLKIHYSIGYCTVKFSYVFPITGECNFGFSTVTWSKLVTIQWIKSRIWDMIDDWYIHNLAKNHVSAVFLSCVICRSVSPKLIELCMEKPCL